MPILQLLNLTCPAALGKEGIIAAADKREGDGKTPIGRWPLREVWYRPDRVQLPPLKLPTRAIQPEDGWCDAPDDPNYNRHVTHPYPASAEHLWREDDRYDILVTLGHNDDPVVPGLGSAIFFHLAEADFSGTAGCIAITRQHMLAVLTDCSPTSLLEVTEDGRVILRP